MGRTSRLCAMLAVILATAGVAACGGGDEMSADEKQIRATLTKALTSTDPAICRSLMTASFVRQITEETTVTAALTDCRQEVKRDQAKSVEIKRVDRRESRASAVFHTEGGVLPFEEATVSLRRADRTWRVHRLTAATLDRPRFFQVGRRQLTAPPNRLNDDTASCVLRALKKVSDQRIVASFVDGESSFIHNPALICGVRQGLDEAGASEREQRCIAGRLRRALEARDGDALLEGMLADSAGAQRRFNGIIARCR